MNKKSIFTKFLILMVLLLNISCSTNSEKDEFIERNVAEIYNSAMSLLDKKKI